MHECPVTDQLQPRFETHQPILLAGLVERYNTQNTSGIPEQWQRFGPMIPKIPGRAGHAAYGAVYNFQDNNDFDYLCAVEIDTTAGAGHVPDR
jgi:AraC family transcriptional regulator